MNPITVLAQLRDVYSRMIIGGLSVRQFPPSDSGTPGGGRSIGDVPAAAIALRNIAYQVIYDELERNDAYHIKLPDGGLLLFQYVFSASSQLQRHRLAFFPSAVLPTMEEAPELYRQDELYGDILLNRLVRFPIRIDFDPSSHRDVMHPKCHLTLGQFGGCRIPVTSPIMPNVFAMFIVRNFYSGCYIRNKNTFDRHMKGKASWATITNAERRITHMVMA